jgi:hypothetical protein
MKNAGETPAPRDVYAAAQSALYIFVRYFRRSAA